MLAIAGGSTPDEPVGVSFVEPGLTPSDPPTRLGETAELLLPRIEKGTTHTQTVCVLFQKCTPDAKLAASLLFGVPTAEASQGAAVAVNRCPHYYCARETKNNADAVRVLRFLSGAGVGLAESAVLAQGTLALPCDSPFSLECRYTTWFRRHILSPTPPADAGSSAAAVLPLNEPILVTGVYLRRKTT